MFRSAASRDHWSHPQEELCSLVHWKALISGPPILLESLYCVSQYCQVPVMNPAPSIGNPSPLVIYTRWRSHPNPTASMKASMKASITASMKASMNPSKSPSRHHIQDLIPTDLFNNLFNEHFSEGFVEHLTVFSAADSATFHVAPYLRTSYNALLVSHRDV